MQRLEVSRAVRHLYGSLGVKGLNSRLGGAQSRSGLSGEEKNFLHLLGFEPRIVQPLA